MGLARGLVVLWRWTLGVIDTLLMNFYVWDVGDKCDTIQTIGPIVNAVCLIIRHGHDLVNVKSSLDNWSSQMAVEKMRMKLLCLFPKEVENPFVDS